MLKVQTVNLLFIFPPDRFWSKQFLENTFPVVYYSYEHYLFLGEAVVSAVAVVVSVGANEISEGLLARAELPS